MAEKSEAAESKSVAAKAEQKKPFRVVSGSVLGDPVNGGDAAEKKLRPHKIHRKGATVLLGAKDAADLTRLGVVEPAK
jgi:hypothetical protein